MRVYEEKLSDITRYIENQKKIPLKDYEKNSSDIVTQIKKVKTVTKGMELLEVGMGTGWFQVYANKEIGLRCTALEISPQLVEFGKEFIAANHAEANVLLGNIEDDIGDSKYDIIVADQVFEHVEKYEQGIRNIYKALKPGGAFFFASNNKWANVKSGEFWLPFYNQLPNKVRYKIRVWAQGPDIMKLGIDFNTWTYPQLRRIFKETGFTQIHDKIDLGAPGEVRSAYKRRLLALCKKNRLVRRFVQYFVPGTHFVCIK